MVGFELTLYGRFWVTPKAVILAALQPPTAAEAEMPDAELAKVA